MAKSWNIKTQNLETDPEILKKYHPVTLQILFNRGIKSSGEVDNFFAFNYEKDVPDPFLFSDMEKAVERIMLAKKNQDKIAVFGDYDADGVTATALLFEALSNLGFKNIIPYIPDRQNEGYGMNMEAVEYLAKEGVKLIITVDCGITNVAEIEKAKKLGMDAIITDHHHVPKELPEALATINPHVKNCGYPFPDLAGVGVAFKLAQAIYEKLDEKNIEQTKWLLDLATIGTVADCVPLLGENRTLVKYGLVVLSKTRRVGLTEMFQVGRIMIDENNIPDTQKIAFQIAPRINAAGRMDHANISYKLIIEKNKARAREMSLDLEDKNQQRQKVTAEIVREIRILAENSFRDKKIIFASGEHWPVGILGLAAGKIAEEFNKPTIILRKEDNKLTGSLRSIPQINIIEALEKCSELLKKFGGHSQAAGIEISNEKAEEFYEKFSEIIETELDGKDLTPAIDIDAEISAEDINWDLLSELRKMEPFGEGNEEPVLLLRKMIITDMKMVGNGSKHLKIALRRDGSPKIFDAIGFGFGEKNSGLKEGDMVDIVFNLQEDEWNGNKKMQLKLVDIKASQNVVK